MVISRLLTTMTELLIFAVYMLQHRWNLKAI